MAPFNITQLKSMKYGLDALSHFTQAPISLSEHYIPTMSTGAKWLPIQLHWGHLPITYGLSLEKKVDTFYNITRSSSNFSLCSSTYCSAPVPTAPPANLTVTAVTSRTATLSWDPPPYEEQNGVIREYMLTVNRSDTSFFIVLNTTMTQLTVEHLLPFRTYLFTVAAQTIELGPFTMVEEIQLLEDGNYFI